MKLFPRVARCGAFPLATGLALTLAGCASPGPPRPPSLHLPAPARDLSAARVGDSVQLRFTVPRTSTDGSPLRGDTVLGTACRQEDKGPCLPFATGSEVGGPAAHAFPLAGSGGGANVVELEDSLPATLRGGAPRLLAYKVEFFSAARRSAGASASAYAVAGAAPPPLTGFAAEGSRGGILLHWRAATAPAGEVLLRREEVNPPRSVAPTPQPATGPASPGVSSRRRPASGGARTTAGESTTVWLQANAGQQSRGSEELSALMGVKEAAAADRGRTLDPSAVAGTAYRYRAQRRQTLQLEGRTLETRSELSAPVLFTLSDTFPLPTPAGLTAANFGEGTSYVVDLIWEPVQDKALAGYVVRRALLDSAGQPQGTATALNAAAPATLPAFHDNTAKPAGRYRYEVEAVDAKGNRSAAATVVVEPWER